MRKRRYTGWISRRPNHRASHGRQYPEQNKPARIQRIPSHAQDECHHRGGQLLHHPGGGLRPELLASRRRCASRTCSSTPCWHKSVATSSGACSEKGGHSTGGLSQPWHATGKSHSGINGRGFIPGHSCRTVRPFIRTALATPFSVMTSSYRSNLS